MDRVAFVSNRSGEMRVWVSALDGSDKLVSKPIKSYHDKIKAPSNSAYWSPLMGNGLLTEGIDDRHESIYRYSQSEA